MMRWAQGSRLRPALVVVTSVVAMVGCGGADSVGSGTDSAGPAASGETLLEIEVSQDGRTPTTQWVLECDPDGGSHPAPDEACDFLRGAPPDVFDPVPPETVCTEIYGGDQTARVVGTWDGQRVDAAFSRINGCEIDRWDTVLPLLQEPGGV